MDSHGPFVRLGWNEILELPVARLVFRLALVEYHVGLVVAGFADAPLELHRRNGHAEQQTKVVRDC